MLPVDIVLAPEWWHQHEGITFDEDYFYHPKRRVEVERQMEKALYERWGRYGQGCDHDKDLPQVGAVHLAAGFMLSEMMGCEVQYREGAPPQVIPAGFDTLSLDGDAPFQSPVYQRFRRLTDALKSQYGYLLGDVNWSGVINMALDLRGQQFFMDMFDQPEQARTFLSAIAQVLARFITEMEQETGSTSISVNRIVRFFEEPVCLHSACSYTMISDADYENFVMPFDRKWSEEHAAYGIHYCGCDPHRHAAMFARLPQLRFLDVGWGGDVNALRKLLPETFLSIRLSPVELIEQSVEQIRETITRLVEASGNLALTGVCCVNVDHRVSDEQVDALFETVAELREMSGRGDSSGAQGHKRAH